MALDPPESRAKIPEFLKKYGLHCRVLLGEMDQPKGYETRALGMLYAVSRDGLLAALPGDFEPDFSKKLESTLSDLAGTKPVRGRLAWSLEKAPAGFGVLWRQPLEGSVAALAIAPASKGHPAEIGLLSEARLRRYSASGEALGDALLENGEYLSLKGADLDGDGAAEWIVGTQNTFTTMDASGREYWSYASPATVLEIAGLEDLDGDGSREIVIRDGSSVVARKATAGNLWKTPPLGSLKSVVPDPRGGFLVQTESGTQALDQPGRLIGTPVPGAGDEVLLGRIARGGDGVLDLFGDPYHPDVQVADGMTGGGDREIVVLGSGVLTAFSEEGKTSLILTFPYSLRSPLMAVGNLDGRPGDELVLAIDGYGLVALGFPSETRPGAPGP